VIAAKVRQNGRHLVSARLVSAGVGTVVIFPATSLFGVRGAAWALVLQALLQTVCLGVSSLRPNVKQAVAPATASEEVRILNSAPERVGAISGPRARPHVSVVIPVHNGANYIEAAIQSVLEQTFGDLEVIVINDGSVDDTVGVVKSIDDPRVRLISQEQGGVAAARNCGIRESSGEFLAFLDHDDVWFPEKLATQLQVFEDATVGVVGSFMTYLTERGPADAASGEIVEDQQERIVAGRLMPFPLSSSIARTELIRSLGGFDESLARVAQVEDLDLIARAASVATVETVGTPLGYYRVHPGAASFRTFDAMRQGARFVRDRIAAAENGVTLSWEDWRLTASESPRARRDDRANFLYRSAGYRIVSGRWARGLLDLACAAALAPHYVLPRLLRQRRAARSSR